VQVILILEHVDHECPTIALAQDLYPQLIHGYQNILQKEKNLQTVA